MSAFKHAEALLEDLVLTQQQGGTIQDIARSKYRHWQIFTSHIDDLISDAAIGDAELREFLYRQGLRDIRGRNTPQSTKSNKGEQAGYQLPSLTPKEMAALEIIKSRGPIVGVAVAEAIKVSYPRFRSVYVPRLKMHGVRNDKDGNGYYYVDCP